ncbi:acyl-CoA dehydrogenase family protein [Sphingomicrobium astaxanthinifaciens]|uniref:acyl-CoA dehydrogenase family protein n=1 Tax=Sphingomicrobium astaxanthinifaciens TaxID=1227949 RepID=UPI001FCA7F42|nr:acyl-CoA dehydrogenase family protein [Sphingomicrobium astaxanthinifaciens]MCJ7420493.1 acyl-CoA dehydrogenase family protein [Sphingomicrobium astaxanthinifaciens]
MDLDWPFFDDHHRELGARLEAWCSEHLGAVDHRDTDAACRRLVGQLGAGGWLRYCVPASHGGVHETIDVRSLAILRATLARHDALADFAFAMQGLGSGTISLFGSEAQKAAILPAVAAGEKIAAFALTEPRSGSDVANIETSAVATGEGWRVDGAKSYISNGGIADYYVLFARTGEAPGARGLSAFLVPADTPGLDDKERIEVIAPHPLSTLRFSAMALPAEALIGERGRGFQQAMATLDIFRTSVGAAALGFAQRAYAETLDRVTRRALGAGTLADSPVTQSTLAEMALGIDSAGLLIARAGWVRDVTGRRNSREAAMAKLAATEQAQAIIDQAVQLHGGLGVTKGVAVEALYRDIRALRIYEGASEVQKLVIAKSILKERG